MRVAPEAGPEAGTLVPRPGRPPRSGSVVRCGVIGRRSSRLAAQGPDRPGGAGTPGRGRRLREHRAAATTTARTAHKRPPATAKARGTRNSRSLPRARRPRAARGRWPTEGRGARRRSNPPSRAKATQQAPRRSPRRGSLKRAKAADTTSAPVKGRSLTAGNGRHASTMELKRKRSGPGASARAWHRRPPGPTAPHPGGAPAQAPTRVPVCPSRGVPERDPACAHPSDAAMPPHPLDAAARAPGVSPARPRTPQQAGTVRGERRPARAGFPWRIVVVNVDELRGDVGGGGTGGRAAGGRSKEPLPAGAPARVSRSRGRPAGSRGESIPGAPVTGPRWPAPRVDCSPRGMPVGHAGVPARAARGSAPGPPGGPALPVAPSPARWRADGAGAGEERAC
jgi:hypothetical protein